MTVHLCRAAALILLAAGLARAGETVTVSALSVVQTETRIVGTAEGMHVAGEVAGPFFVDAGRGPVDVGDLTCIADVRGDATSGRISGSGSCVIAAHDGARAFAEWTCEGVAFVGCHGDFRVTGGDGRLEGLTGSGRMTMRTGQTQIHSAQGADAATGAGRGIVTWDELVLVLP